MIAPPTQQLIQDILSANSPRDAGEHFIAFARHQNAVVASVCLGFSLSDFRITTLPDEAVEWLLNLPSKETAHQIKAVLDGRSSLFWGIDLDANNPQSTPVGRQISEACFKSFRQRSSVTFSMQAQNGRYRGAGVTIGFDLSGVEFTRKMEREWTEWSLLSFIAHSRIQLLLQDGTRPSPLTKRQSEILTYMASGMQLSLIADEIGITDSTVNLHLSRLKNKLKARTKEQALAIALSNGWINP